MGTWGEGLLDGDAQLDLLGELMGDVLERVSELAEREATHEAARELVGGLGLLLQHCDYAFEDEDESERIAAAIEQQRPAFSGLSVEARELIERVCRGEIPNLDEGRDDAELTKIVGAAGGPRYAAFFETDEARAVVQRLVDAAAEVLDEEMKLGDLYELAMPIGLVGLLLTIAPWTLEPARIAAWRNVARESWATMVAELGEDGTDMPFFASYMNNVEAAFDRLLASR